MVSFTDHLGSDDSKTNTSHLSAAYDAEGQSIPATPVAGDRKIITLRDVRKDTEVETYIRRGNEHLGECGFTEHGQRHADLVSSIARNILLRLGQKERDAELSAIAGYLHDIGNVVSRYIHGQTGAVMAWKILERLGMPADEIATVVSAIGNHDPEELGQPVNQVAAALILADKSDVHRSRVRVADPTRFDIHDRVNYAVTRSFVNVNGGNKTITLELSVDTDISPVMDYFEIFLARMIMCRRAAAFLGCQFELLINDTRLL
ncbi:MAG TPA: HD domain-containing protein [Clostridia bacterium]|nr:HD domain-containing protein [Clostridia bacterium]